MRKHKLRKLIGSFYDKIFVLSKLDRKNFIELMEKDFLPIYNKFALDKESEK